MKSVAWGEPQPQECPDCGGVRHMVNGEVLDDGERTVAVFMSFLYDHGGGREVFMDLILGPWGDGSDPSERLTFSTRTGPVEGGSIASTLLDGGYLAPDDPLLGTKVSREDGLAHPQIVTVWSYVDSVLAEVPAVSAHLAGPAAPPHRRWPWSRHR